MNKTKLIKKYNKFAKGGYINTEEDDLTEGNDSSINYVAFEAEPTPTTNALSPDTTNNNITYNRELENASYTLHKLRKALASERKIEAYNQSALANKKRLEEFHKSVQGKGPGITGGSRSFDHGRSIVKSINMQNPAETFVKVSDDVKDKRQEYVDYQLEYGKNFINSALTAAELATGVYAAARGAAKANVFFKRLADKRAGLLPTQQSLETMRAINLANKIDKAQLAMSSMGTTADVSQFIMGDRGWVNDAEIVGGTAGIVGATNWFRNTPLFTRFGKTIDNVLDVAGYMAAGYDLYHGGKAIYDFINENSPLTIESDQVKANGGNLNIDGEKVNINWDKVAR